MNRETIIALRFYQVPNLMCSNLNINSWFGTELESAILLLCKPRISIVWIQHYINSNFMYFSLYYFQPPFSFNANKVEQVLTQSS